MNGRILTCILLAAIAPAAVTSCRRAGSAPAGDAHETHSEESHAANAEPAEPSDLDRPVEELVALTCEHEKKTFECDECRYEAGFVRAPASLVAGGLISTVRAGRQKVAVPVTLTGEVRFDERLVGHVSSPVEGIIRATHVTLGDRVRKGQPLVEIESVAVGEAQAAWLEARSLLSLARRNFERLSALREENISSEKETLQARQELETAEIRAANALGTLTRLGVGSADARTLTSATAGGRIVLRSPMDGLVLTLHAVPGETARTEEALATVGDNSTVWVWADLYERDIRSVVRGQASGRLEASVSVKAYPDEVFAGAVDLVTQAMDESSRTVKVRVEVRNRAGHLLSGMFASVRLYLPGADEALAVPGSAVLEDEGRSFVFVHHEGDDYVRRPVTVGRTWAGWAEVTSGLSPGQVVVAEGAFLMKSDVLRSKMGAGCAD
ncbi:MAG TPA: efflux RND transporter periplasmic adaptor subunit [Thermoanaerobaculia bacterium]|jgi:cobalt-zinc-cadmium efflux system membrane fusion protein|nr:efflux RND transporter periplasmic adaptor subunit [Thermoanaerobaculia bacterium]HPA51005.1 efflux RND transporter periplasmic adaptor subunit [Thermoanaerobaculia bacterium]HQN06271.1 efflux RND transporter periplasmic adaptor subunit [Thermoanaerobaculia bacterium]